MAAGTVIKSFSTPSTAPRGLAFDGTHLWHNDNTTDLIYQLNRDGQIIKSFSQSRALVESLAFNRNCLYLTGHATALAPFDIILMNRNGVVVHEILAQTAALLAVAFDGVFIPIFKQILIPAQKLLTLWSQDFTLIHQVSTQESRDLGYDGRSFWTVLDTTNQVFEIDRDGRVIKSFTGPGSNPRSVAVDGNYLWIADGGTLQIYMVERV